MSEQELIKALVAEDAQPSAEFRKLEEEIDNLDPSELHTGSLARFLIISKNHKLVFHIGNTTGSGPGPQEGKGTFYGNSIQIFFPQSEDQYYTLRIRGREAFLTLRKGSKIVYHAPYTGVQHGLDGVWKGKWRQSKDH